MSKGFRDRLRYDAELGEYRDGPVRYLMIRPDALMGVLHQLPPEQRPNVLAAFARSVTAAGGDSARMYQAQGGDEAAALAQTIAETAPQLGWGAWTMEVGDGRIDVRVSNSPFAAGFGRAEAPVCHPIVGMLQAVGPMILGGPVRARETACAATGASACEFVATGDP